VRTRLRMRSNNGATRCHVSGALPHRFYLTVTARDVTVDAVLRQIRLSMWPLGRPLCVHAVWPSGAWYRPCRSRWRRIDEGRSTLCGVCRRPRQSLLERHAANIAIHRTAEHGRRSCRAVPSPPSEYRPRRPPPRPRCRRGWTPRLAGLLFSAAVRTRAATTVVFVRFAASGPCQPRRTPVLDPTD